MEERAGNKKICEQYYIKSVTSILVDSSYQLIAEFFSPHTPYLKVKSCKPNQSQSLNTFERCEYQITCRPPIQLFRTNQDCKNAKKTEENYAQPCKKILKTNKTLNKVFQHNPIDSESLKIYRDLYIYKSLGSVARKNLERAIAAYNANREEIESNRKFTSKRSFNSYRKEQSHHKKVTTEEPFKSAKPKTGSKEKLTKPLKYSSLLTEPLQGKTLQLTDIGTTACKNIGKLNEENLQKDINQKHIESLVELKGSSNDPRNKMKKIVIKNNFEQILPQLPVRQIERRIKEKKQLALAVLNISLPSLNENKGERIKNSEQKIYQDPLKKSICNDYNGKSFFHSDSLEETDEDFEFRHPNRKRIVNDIKGKSYSSKNNKVTIKKRGYLLKLPIAEANDRRFNFTSSSNLSLLTFQEADKSFELLSSNDRFEILPRNETGHKSYSLRANSQSIPVHRKPDTDPRKLESEEAEFLNNFFSEKDKKKRVCEINNSFPLMHDHQEHINKTRRGYSKLRQTILNSDCGFYQEKLIDKEKTKEFRKSYPTKRMQKEIYSFKRELNL